MDEVRRVSEALHPDYTFFVVDAMTGQDAVQTAEAFHQALQLDGIILTKVDGDARGGGRPLGQQVVDGRSLPVHRGTGGRLRDLPSDRLASRILGMGDVLSLIEKAEREYDEEVTGQTIERLQAGRSRSTISLISCASSRRWGRSRDCCRSCRASRKRCVTPRSTTATWARSRRSSAR